MEVHFSLSLSSFMRLAVSARRADTNAEKNYQRKLIVSDSVRQQLQRKRIRNESETTIEPMPSPVRRNSANVQVMKSIVTASENAERNSGYRAKLKDLQAENVRQDWVQIRRWEAKSDFLELVTIALFFALSLGSLDADLLVVLLQGCEIFARLGEFTFGSISHA